MPIYEYACAGCGNDFEMLVRADTVPTCPRCASTQLERRLSTFAAHTAAAPASASPCARCGNPEGPGACALR